MNSSFKCLTFCLIIGVIGVGLGCNQAVDPGGDDYADAGVTPDRPDAGGGDSDSGSSPDVYDPATPCESHSDCDDDVACTDDSCNKSTATCRNIPVNALCSDDNNVCSQRICYSGVGCMTEAVDGLSCNSGNACALEAVCQAGSCEVAVVRDCNDGNACTDDSCNPSAGCMFTANSNSCNDGSDFTTGDMCVNGVCKGAGGTNCLSPSDCHDGNPCTTLGCVDGVCQTVGAPCDDGIACTADSCLPGGGCVNTPKNSLCGYGEICKAQYGCAQCTKDAECQDGNSCTADRCLDGMCVHTPQQDVGGSLVSSDGETCDDSNKCTTKSWCANGVCGNHGVVEFVTDCDDGEACTKDWCDPGYGCGHQEFDSCDGGVTPPPTTSTEKCNGVDDDNDGKIDEVGAEGCTTYYWDGDGDGYGKAGSSCLCSKPNGYSAVNTDCNDANPTVHPGASEVCSDGVDQDCSGADKPCGDTNSPYCEVTLLDDRYELNGIFPGAQCMDTNPTGANWCIDVSALKIYGSGKLYAQAKCKTGQDCNHGKTTWGVGDTNWDNGCTTSELVVLSNLFELSAHCSCKPVCMGGEGSGDPNLECEWSAAP